MYILGISSYYHDSAACLLRDGEIIAAAQEERFTRKKHDPDFPHHSIKFCIEQAGILPEELTSIVFYEKPFLKFERLLETYLAFAPKGFRSFASAIPLWLKEKLFQKSILLGELGKTLGNEVDWESRLLFSEHHLSHAASAFYPSPFDRAAILTLDGVGEWTTTSWAVGKGSSLEVVKEIHFPHSLGLLYSAFTYYIGFKVNSGEYKVMGLAPYGEPKYVNLIKDSLIQISQDGSFQLDMSYFNFAAGLTMTSKKFDALFGCPPRNPESDLTQLHMDLAASVQKVTEEIVVKIAKNIARVTGEKNLCLAGGVALNCVANGVLLRENIFQKIWIQPAAGDAGGALGAALAVWYMHHGKARAMSSKRDSMSGSFLGPEYGEDQIEEDLVSLGAKFHKLPVESLIDTVASALVEQKAIGWMQGRMEFGPRALGGRSIIADPRSPLMQKKLNLKVKYRESFRPFAPSVLSDDADKWFELEVDSPYMLLVANVQPDQCKEVSQADSALLGIDKLNVPRSEVPAVTHVDFSSRVQTIHRDTNPMYYDLVKKFKEKSGCPIVINTSFNVRGEPIVCTPKDAFGCFMGTELDILVVGNFLLIKEEQQESLKKSYKDRYELD